jgi:hypothetical protein
MTDQVIPMSTAEWQRWKLGPSFTRDAAWARVELLPVVRAFELMSQRLDELGRVFATVGRLINEAFAPVVAAFAPVLNGLDGDGLTGGLLDAGRVDGGGG